MPSAQNTLLGLALVTASFACRHETRVVENSAPVSSEDIAMLRANSRGNVLELLENDRDPDGDNLYIRSLGVPDQKGHIEVLGRTQVSYTPASGFIGTESFTYSASDGRGGTTQSTVTVTVTPVDAAFVLQLLHASDMESAAGSLQDVPRFAAVLSALRDQSPDNSLIVSAGNNYAASAFYSASHSEQLASLLGRGCGDTVVCSGRADMAILNALGFQASAFGNHEFDEGTARIADLLGQTSTWEGTRFPYVAANLGFSGSEFLNDRVLPSGEPAQPSSIARSVTVNVAGENIGIVGATTPALARIAQADDIEIFPAQFGGIPSAAELLALAQVIQTSVDELSKAGVNKIVLLLNLKVLNIERQLAALLQNVDIIVVGGSGAILADPTDRLRDGDVSAGSYPEIRDSASGEPMLLISTGGEWRYVGRMVVGFDADGRVLLESLNESISGSYAADEAGVAALGAGAPDPTVDAIVSTIGEVLLERDGVIFGKSTVYLEGRDLRTPNFGTRGEETNLGNLTADAELFAAQSSVPDVAIALQNGGGIRSSIGFIGERLDAKDASELLFLPTRANPSAGKLEGEISAFDIESALPFDDPLVVLSISAEELRALLEHGIELQPSRQGRFPQVAGMTFSYDTTEAAGERIRQLVVLDGNGLLEGVEEDIVVEDGLLVGDPERRFMMVTIAFLQQGGDGYPFPSPRDCVYLADDGSVPPQCEVLVAAPELDVTFFEPGRVQHAFAANLSRFYAGDAPFDQVDTAIERDERIQSLVAR